jgi:pre-rRNA-processing protein TSR2
MSVKAARLHKVRTNNCAEDCTSRIETDLLIEKCKAEFELGVTLSLFFWPSLSLAVVNHWGGPDSKDKREWFAQTTIDLLNENPDADLEWIEEFLLQVMLDEFEVNVDDESGFEVAEQILRLRKDCSKGDFREVHTMKEKWDRKGGEDVGKLFEKKERNEEDDETDGSEEDSDDEEKEDVDMDEAPPLVRVKEPVIPEVDEDGFTKVTKKKR